jgi:hypothetical protein
MEDHQYFSYAPFLLSSSERSVGPDYAVIGEVDSGSPDPWPAQVEAAREEWRRRHPKVE